MSASSANQAAAEDVASGGSSPFSTEEFLAALMDLMELVKQGALADRRQQSPAPTTTEDHALKPTHSTSSNRNTNNTPQILSVQNPRDTSSFHAILGHTIGPTLEVYKELTRLAKELEDDEEREPCEDAALSEALDQWVSAVRASRPFLDSVREAEDEEHKGS